MSEPEARLISDFDGTAVAIMSKFDPRNWMKYPLPVIEGYLDFLRGAHLGGVEIAAIASRRPDILPRRIATARSVAKLGMDAYFGEGRGRVVLAGSERSKAEFVLAKSIGVPTGMIDDKPHRIGAELVEGMRRLSETPEVEERRILLGVVNHTRSEAYIRRFASDVQQSGGEVLDTDSGVRVVVAEHTLDVVLLEPYSQQAGQQFAERLFGLDD